MIREEFGGKHMRKINYQTKFLLYHAAILIFIIVGVVGYFYYLISNEYKENDKKDFQVIAEKTAEQIDSLFYEMDFVALQIAANPSIVNVFQKIPETAEGHYFRIHPSINIEVKNLLESYNFKNDSFSRICLYNDYKDFVCTSNRAITEYGISNFFFTDSFNSIQKYFSDSNNYIYYKYPETDVLSENDNVNQDYFSVVREIKDYYSNSLQCGYVEVQESTDRIFGILDSLGTDIYVEIRDENGNIFYQKPDQHLTEEKNVYKTEVKIDNTPFVACFTKKIIEYDLFSIVLCLVVLLLIIVAIILEKNLISYLTKPLLELNRSIETVTMDNLHVDIVDENSMDILLNLEKSFNAMLEKLNDSMQKVIISHTNEVKAQFFALQSQINPHFIHNMLAIISIESQMDGNRKIPYICQNLGNMLRYNSQMGDGYSTIEQECESAENYMKLMKIRYEDLFRYDIEIKDNTELVRIPKLILQPLCENCFQHGLKNVEPEWVINVVTWSEDGRWFLKVSDNGSGFTEEFLEKFKSGKEKMDNSNVKSVLENIEIGGLCLANIYIRLKIAYEESMTFELFNDKRGAIVMIGGEIRDSSSCCRR